MATPRNKHKVPKAPWAKWSNARRQTFNDIYESMRQNQSFYNAHPRAKQMTPAQWEMLAWNVAWVDSVLVDDADAAD